VAAWRQAAVRLAAAHRVDRPWRQAAADRLAVAAGIHLPEEVGAVAAARLRLQTTENWGSSCKKTRRQR